VIYLAVITLAKRSSHLLSSHLRESESQREREKELDPAPLRAKTDLPLSTNTQ